MILVTGGSGYIGSHTALTLLNKDHEILILDNLSNSKKSDIHRLEKLSGKKFLLSTVIFVIKLYWPCFLKIIPSIQ